MADSTRFAGPKVLAAFALVVLGFFALLMVAFWRGPKGKFTEASLATPIDAPALVRTFCIDPARSGPKSLEDFPRCANTDRLEFTVSPVPGQKPFAAWVLVGPQAVGVVTHGALEQDWSQPIPLKGLPPGAYALIYVLSDKALLEPELKGVVEAPTGNLARLQALETWAKAAGPGVKLVRLPFQVEAPAAPPPAPPAPAPAP